MAEMNETHGAHDASADWTGRKGAERPRICIRARAPDRANTDEADRYFIRWRNREEFLGRRATHRVGRKATNKRRSRDEVLYRMHRIAWVKCRGLVRNSSVAASASSHTALKLQWQAST
jgi:hypothetical protein